MKNPDNVFDDSTSIMTQIILLDDGREVEAECWAEDGDTYLTYRLESFCDKGLNAGELIDYLNSNGMQIEAKYRSRAQIIKRTRNGKIMFDLTMLVAESDD